MILVVAPHFDDGALSCGAHGLAWRECRRAVHVLTVFSQAQASVTGVLAAADPSSLDWARYIAQRRSEEHEALRLLDFSGDELGMIDAGFRPEVVALSIGRQPRSSSGNAHAAHASLIDDAVRRLKPYAREAEWVIAPLGVGGHVDHLVTRWACERAFDASRLIHYLDMPYGQNWRNWAPHELWQACSAARSWRRGDDRKLKALAAYVSQRSIVFRGGHDFRELLLFSSRAQRALFG